jgi:hypothetical protein
MRCGTTNLHIETFDACVAATVDAERRGHRASFFTSQMQGYYEPEILQAVTGRALGSDRIGMGFPDPAPVIAAAGAVTHEIELTGASPQPDEACRWAPGCGGSGRRVKTVTGGPARCMNRHNG